MQNDDLKRVILLKNEKKYKEAIKIAKSLYKKTKDNCFNNEIYDCLVNLNKRHDAIKILLEMIKKEPENLLLYKRLAYNYFFLGDFKTALKHYKFIIENEPLSSANYFNAGSMCHYMKDYKKACFYYDVALKLDKKNVAAANNMGLAFYETDDWKKALEFFDYALKIAPNHPEAWHHVGVINRDVKNDCELASIYIKKAIKLDPNYFDNYYQLALTYAVWGKKKEALELARQCYEKRPSHEGCAKLLETLKEVTV